ncbi:MAG: HAMP domain-containing histidine kinase [Acidobacteria bacterium]|nr:HAMP domain-containing histidine kinase [Acidobacteriota bacterium]
MAHVAGANDAGVAGDGSRPPVTLTWLVTVRWTTLGAGAGAMLAGHRALEVSAPLVPSVALLLASAASNGWLLWRVRARPAPSLPAMAGLLICADVLLLSWLIWRSGGVLNPASIFYLVQIVVAALVLGPVWTWTVTALAVGTYAALFVAMPEQLAAAQSMHPEIRLHMQGMWVAFAGTALIVAVLVARLAIAVERRDRALAALRDQTARATRVAGLATLAAGAAHELSTPLATIVVAAGELERSVVDGGGTPEWQHDANLIRLEASRCRDILDSMAGGSGEVLGDAPQPVNVSEVIAAATGRLNAADRARVMVDVAGDVRVVWPLRVVARAVGNLLRNAAQASGDREHIRLDVKADGDLIRLSVIDRGTGMSPEQLGRAGEPFFTTKPAGEGTGLGLFVTRSSVEQLGGRLILSSRPERGTTATIELPRDVIGPRTGARA